MQAKLYGELSKTSPTCPELGASVEAAPAESEEEEDEQPECRQCHHRGHTEKQCAARFCPDCNKLIQSELNSNMGNIRSLELHVMECKKKQVKTAKLDAQKKAGRKEALKKHTCEHVAVIDVLDVEMAPEPSRDLCIGPAEVLMESTRTWMRCDILRKGTLPDTYNIRLQPELAHADEPIRQNVPCNMLRPPSRGTEVISFSALDIFKKTPEQARKSPLPPKPKWSTKTLKRGASPTSSRLAPVTPLLEPAEKRRLSCLRPPPKSRASVAHAACVSAASSVMETSGPKRGIKTSRIDATQGDQSEGFDNLSFDEDSAGRSILRSENSDGSDGHRADDCPGKNKRVSSTGSVASASDGCNTGRSIISVSNTDPPDCAVTGEIRLCKFGCGYAADGEFTTCCSKCTGNAGPHSRDCAEKSAARFSVSSISSPPVSSWNPKTLRKVEEGVRKLVLEGTYDNLDIAIIDLAKLHGVDEEYVRMLWQSTMTKVHDEARRDSIYASLAEEHYGIKVMVIDLGQYSAQHHNSCGFLTCAVTLLDRLERGYDVDLSNLFGSLLKDARGIQVESHVATHKRICGSALGKLADVLRKATCEALGKDKEFYLPFFHPVDSNPIYHGMSPSEAYDTWLAQLTGSEDADLLAVLALARLCKLAIQPVQRSGYRVPLIDPMDVASSGYISYWGNDDVHWVWMRVVAGGSV